jgi:ribosomal protein L11 methyltransferase
MAWLELSVAVDQEAVESVSELLASYGYQRGVVIEPPCIPTDDSDGWVGTPGLSPDPPPAQYTVDLSLPVTLRTYLPMDEQAEEIRQRLEQSLWHLGQLRPVGPLQVRVLEEQDWANEWKNFYHVQRIGVRTVIVPSWLDYDPHPGDVVLHLDPGMAFGTGLHPTTQLCLQLIEQHIRPGVRVLDVGTGSGILSIAAAKLGAASVLALDNDPVAVDVACENVGLNQVSDQVSVALGSLASASKLQGAATTHPPVLASGQSFDARFETVVANIIASVLVELAPALAATLVPGGTLISSGIIQEREAEVAQAMAAAGLHLHERHQAGEWLALVHTHPPEAQA